MRVAAFLTLVWLSLPAFGQGARPEILLPTLPAAANAPGLHTQAQAVRFNAARLLAMRRLEEAQVTLPDGATHAIVLEALEDHPNGIHSWIGYHREHGRRFRTVITAGPAGTFGVIETPQGEFRIVPGEGGHDWLIDMTREAAFHPPINLGNDARRVRVPKEAQVIEGEPTLATGGTTFVEKAAPTPAYVVDLMFVVTNGLSTRLGANLATRLNFLVARANTAYADSEVAITLRLVTTVVVNYSDSTDDGTALDAITPVGGGGGGVFANVEAVRTAYGADLVALVRNGPDYGGSGIAWIPTPPSAPYMYSVTTGCVLACESVFIHELGHNYGNEHDRATTAWQAGGTSSYPQGAYPYSYGYVYCASGALSCNPYVAGGCASQPECSTTSSNNFATLMSYFQGTASVVYRFSNPNITCGPESRACGIIQTAPNSAYDALSMNNVRAAVSAIKPTAVLATSTTALVSSLNPSLTGQSITLTATVSGSSGTPTGSVAFRDAGVAISGCASVTLGAGRAACATSALAAGTHSLTAAYSGDAIYGTSTSTALSQAVNASLVLSAVRSRKTHGAAGNFDLSIDATQPLTGSVTVEPRVISTGHRLIFQFDRAITSAGTAATTVGSVSSTTVSGSEVHVVLTGIPDNRRATVTLTNTNASGLAFAASIGFLVGDENNTRSVNATDVTLVKGRAGETVGAANNLYDVNLSGAVTAADILAAKGRSGLSIP